MFLSSHPAGEPMEVRLPSLESGNAGSSLPGVGSSQSSPVVTPLPKVPVVPMLTPTPVSGSAPWLSLLMEKCMHDVQRTYVLPC